MAQNGQAFESVTLGHIRGHGCRDLLIYCEAIGCHHRSIMNADHLPDDLPIRSLGPRMVCARCGHRAPMCGRIGGHTQTSGMSKAPALEAIGSFPQLTRTLGSSASASNINSY
jgi:hypothetical protein